MRCRLLPVLCSPERLTKLLRRTHRETLSLPPNERWRNAAFTGMKSTACMDRSWNSLFALIKRGLVWQSPDASTWRLLPRLSFCPGRTRPFTFPEDLGACVPAWSRRCAVNGFTSNLLSILPEESNARLRFWVFVMDRLQLDESGA